VVLAGRRKHLTSQIREQIYLIAYEDIITKAADISSIIYNNKELLCSGEKVRGAFQFFFLERSKTFSRQMNVGLYLVIRGVSLLIHRGLDSGCARGM